MPTDTLTFYGHPRCSTVKKAKVWLDAQCYTLKEYDLTENAPPATLLRKALKQDGMTLKKLFNTSGMQYREQCIKDKLETMSEAEAIDLLAGNGMLVKRPLVTDGKQVTVGFKAEVFEKVWG
jgi:arsenate reductase